MKTTDDSDNEIMKEMMPSIIGIACLSIARKIFMKEIEPDNIKTPDQLSKIVEKLGKIKEDGFEIHTDTISEQIKIIEFSFSNNEYRSAIVLLFTLIESEINLSIRILLRIRNFSHNLITTALQGTDFKSKIDILLPLLGVQMPDRIKQLAFESHKIRNAIIHFKATPDICSDEKDLTGDFEKIKESSYDFFKRNPIDRAEEDIKSIAEVCLESCPEFCQAHDLFEKFET